MHPMHLYIQMIVVRSDYRPTDQDEEVRQTPHSELGTQLTAVDELPGKDLVAFNEILRERKVPNVMVRKSGGRF
jgi:hypothetical protein